MAGLLFERDPAPTPGPVRLLFGEGASAPLRLRFELAPIPTPGPVRLLFGEGVSTPVLPATTATVSVPLPGPGLAVRLAPPNDTTAVVPLPGPGVAVQIDFDLNVSRPTVVQAGVRHQVAQPLPAGVQPLHQVAQPLPAGVQPLHQVAQPLPTGVQAKHERAGETRASALAAHQSAEGRRAQVDTAHQLGARVQNALLARQQNADSRRAGARTAHQERYRDRRPAHVGRHQEAARARAWRTGAHQPGRPAWLRRDPRHQEAMRPPIGRWAPPVVPPFDPCYLPSTRLLFSEAAAASTRLFFICDRHGPPPPRAPLVIPIRRIYMVTNTLSLRRLSDDLAIPASALSVSLDVDSWAWQASANVPGTALASLSPTAGEPVALVADVNGMSFQFLVEGLARDRTFGTSSLSVRGRSRNAVLAAPYAVPRSYTNTGASTAQQLALQALTLNGVPLPWALDWGLENWLVPAGAWVHQGTTIQALTAIAEAAGGYLVPDPASSSIAVRHRYPALPRDWAAVVPDVELPSAVVIVEGIEWIEKPRFNRVFVGGGPIGGRLGQVTLTGSAGDLVAPMVVDPLLTDIAALRQRARALLGDTGRQAMVRLRVPALPELGLLRPGKFLRYTDGPSGRIGLVRSVELSASDGQAWQTLGVETHE